MIKAPIVGGFASWPWEYWQAGASPQPNPKFVTHNFLKRPAVLRNYIQNPKTKNHEKVGFLGTGGIQRLSLNLELYL